MRKVFKTRFIDLADELKFFLDDFGVSHKVNVDKNGYYVFDMLLTKYDIKPIEEYIERSTI